METTSQGVAVSFPNGREPGAEYGEDLYGVLWSRIRELAPRATLLRGPASLNPLQGVGSTDLDILVGSNLAPVRAFLIREGFHRVFKSQPYLERYRKCMRQSLKSYTIDLYRAEFWGLGFRLAGNGRRPAEVRVAGLLHAVVDGKGTALFEKEQGGPPWKFDNHGMPAFGPLGRALWKSGRPASLTLYLFLRGIIRADFLMILRNLYRKAAFRFLQLSRKTGLEVALLGVDGTGKSSLACTLLQLPAPVKVVYMGPHDYATRVMKFADRHRVPQIVRQLAFRYDLMLRRLHGALLARRGWIVVYDRHPAERLDPRETSFVRKIKNSIDRLYAWPVDLTFWLTGDCQILYLRKQEYSAPSLREIDERFQSLLEAYRIPFERIDVTQNDLQSVARQISERVLTRHLESSSMDRWPRILKAPLV